MMIKYVVFVNILGFENITSIFKWDESTKTKRVCIHSSDPAQPDVPSAPWAVYNFKRPLMQQKGFAKAVLTLT